MGETSIGTSSPSVLLVSPLVNPASNAVSGVPKRNLGLSISLGLTEFRKADMVMVHYSKKTQIKISTGRDTQGKVQETPGVLSQCCHMDMFIRPSMACDDMYEVLSTKEAHLSQDVWEFCCRSAP